MTRSKSKKEKLAAAAAAAAVAAESAESTDHQPERPPNSSSSASSNSSSTPAAAPSSSALIICRNKHWRYISSFHGPWLQLPPEVLESLAYSNYSAPRPRPIDPAVFFDLVKIRRHVDEATTLAVRAASGIASSLNSKDHHLLLGIGTRAPTTSPRLSRERKHRMRELATQKLARAYKLDEIAASVATMQSASSLEDVAALVLQRNPRDADAEYVHFFHEKIPSRMLAKCTSLAPLDRVIAERPTEGAPLRTRAVTRVFKDDFHGAAADLTAALNLGKRMAALHDDQGADVEKGVVVVRGAGRKLQPTMEDEEMPSSLEAQLLFHRACTYLSVAVGHVEVVLSSPAEDAASDTARKAVRTYAKRALRDYSRFLGFFEYTPGNGEIWSIANMFGPTPPAMLPVAEAESLTYHPLLTDAMYSLLLAHLLLATPLKELVRHAATVNRLARIADGYPVFLAARSPARADWLEVIRRTGLELGIRDGEGEGPGQAEYPVSTERAGTVGRWFKEGRGGVVPGTAKKRRRKPEAAAAGSAAAAGKQPE